MQKDTLSNPDILQPEPSVEICEGILSSLPLNSGGLWEGHQRLHSLKTKYWHLTNEYILLFAALKQSTI